MVTRGWPAGKCAPMDRCQSTAGRAAAPATSSGSTNAATSTGPAVAVTAGTPNVGVTAAGANAGGTAAALNIGGTTASPRIGAQVPPQTWFIISAVFHYLGPSFAVLLFPAVGVLGVAWFRIASAAVVFAPITRPWRLFARMDAAGQVQHERRLLVSMGVCLAVMNCCFYLALARLPISLVAAIEFVGT